MAERYGSSSVELIIAVLYITVFMHGMLPIKHGRSFKNIQYNRSRSTTIALSASDLIC